VAPKICQNAFPPALEPHEVPQTLSRLGGGAFPIPNPLDNFGAPIFPPSVLATRGATASSELGVQFLSLGYYYPSIKKLHRSTQFGAVGYIITLYLSEAT